MVEVVVVVVCGLAAAQGWWRALLKGVRQRDGDGVRTGGAQEQWAAGLDLNLLWQRWGGGGELREKVRGWDGERKEVKWVKSERKVRRW